MKTRLSPNFFARNFTLHLHNSAKISLQSFEIQAITKFLHRIYTIAIFFKFRPKVEAFSSENSF